MELAIIERGDLFFREGFTYIHHEGKLYCERRNKWVIIPNEVTCTVIDTLTLLHKLVISPLQDRVEGLECRLDSLEMEMNHD